MFIIKIFSIVINNNKNTVNFKYLIVFIENLIFDLIAIVFEFRYHLNFEA